MKRKPIAIIVLGLLCVVCAALCLTACSADEKQCNHSYSDWDVVTAATCTTAGEKTRTCTLCGNVEREEIAPAGHDYSSWSEITAATCTEAGKKRRVCTVCEDEDVETITALGHEFATEWTSDENGHWHACIHDGCNVKSDEAIHTESDHYCAFCRSKTSEHDYEVTYEWSETHDECLARRTCRTCSADAAGHEETVYGTVTSTDTQEVSCENDELTTYTATFAVNWAETQIVADIVTSEALGHVYSDEWNSDENGHWHECTTYGCGARKDESRHNDVDHVCSTCGYAVSAHVYGEPTYVWLLNNTICNATRVCSLCSADTAGHEQVAYGEITADVTRHADCDNSELTTFTATFVDDWVETQTLVDVETGGNLGHEYSDKWLCDENAHWHVCNRTGCVSLSGLSAHVDENEDGVCDSCGITPSAWTKTAVAYVVGDGSSKDVNIILNLLPTAGESAFAGIREGYENAKDGSINLTINGVEEIPDNALAGKSIYGSGKFKTVVLGDGVKKIGENAFMYCRAITSITIPASVTSFGNNAFINCGGLADVYYLGEIDDWAKIDFGKIDESITKKEDIDTTALNSSNPCYYGNAKLYFNGTLVETVTIPSSVGTVKPHIFAGCSSIKNVTIESGLTEIGDAAFQSCSNLESVFIGAGVTRIGDDAFNYCELLNSVNIPDGVTSIGESAFHTCSSITSISVPASVTSLGQSAFGNCTKLETVTLVEGLVSIGNYAFGSSAIKSIRIPDSVTTIGLRVFAACKSLTDVTIGSGATDLSVCENLFQNSSALTSITFKAPLTAINKYMFSFLSSAVGNITITVAEGQKVLVPGNGEVYVESENYMTGEETSFGYTSGFKAIVIASSAENE